MSLISRIAAFSILSTASLIRAQDVPQDDWPSPAKWDTWYTGQTYTVEWDSNLRNWFQNTCPACDTSNVDLWLTTASDLSTNFYLLTSSVNVQTATSYSWTVPADLDANEWVFCFIPSGTKWEAGGEEVSSWEFYTRTSTSGSSSSVARGGYGSSSSSVPPGAYTWTASSSVPGAYTWTASSSAPGGYDSTTTATTTDTIINSLPPDTTPWYSSSQPGSSGWTTSSYWQSSQAWSSSSAPPSSGFSTATSTSAGASSAESMPPSSTTAPDATTTNNSPLATNGSTPASQSQRGGLSTGAQAGIGIGAATLALVLIGLGYLLAHKQPWHRGHWWHRGTSVPQGQLQDPSNIGPPAYRDSRRYSTGLYPVEGSDNVRPNPVEGFDNARFNPEARELPPRSLLNHTKAELPERTRLK